MDSSKSQRRRGSSTAARRCPLCLGSRNKRGEGPTDAEQGPFLPPSLPLSLSQVSQAEDHNRQMPAHVGRQRLKAAFFTTQPLYPYQMTPNLGLCPHLNSTCIILYHLGSFCISNSLSSPSNYTVSLFACGLIFLLKAQKSF